MTESTPRTYAFYFQASFRFIGLLITGLMVLLILILIPVMIFSDAKTPWFLAPLMFLACSPFLAMGMYFWLRHSGRVLVNNESITLEGQGKPRTILLRDVVSVTEWDWHIPPGFVLRTATEKIGFSRMLQGLPQLYEFLSTRVAALSLENFKPPIRFMGRRRYLREFLLAFLFIAFIIGIPFAMGMKNQRGGLAGYLEALSLYLFIVLFMTGMGVLGNLPGRRTPADLVLEQGRIALRNLYGTQVFLSPDQIVAVRVEALARRVSSDGVGMGYVDHTFCLYVRDEEKPWKVDSRAARHLRTTPERLLAIFRHVYGLHDSN